MCTMASAQLSATRGLPKMASPIRHGMNRLYGWLFVIVTIAALAAVFHFATKPRTDIAKRPPLSDVTGPQIKR
jgi:hypothetical protein